METGFWLTEESIVNEEWANWGQKVNFMMEIIGKFLMRFFTGLTVLISQVVKCCEYDDEQQQAIKLAGPSDTCKNYFIDVSFSTLYQILH